ncbi:MAG: 50S ribosomal protein L25 [Candidatus Margulisiibacteriota bacterium]
MSSDIVIEAKERVELGKEKVKKLRTKGVLIANVYGKGERNYNLTLNYHEIYQHLSSGNGKNTIFSLNVSGETLRVIAYDIQFHPISKQIVHIDFKMVKANEKVKVRLNIHPAGTALGAKKGGALDQRLQLLTVKLLPEDMMRELTVDVSNLDVGQEIAVKDLHLPKSAEVINTPQAQKVFVIREPRVA